MRGVLVEGHCDGMWSGGMLCRRCGWVVTWTLEDGHGIDVILDFSIAFFDGMQIARWRIFANFRSIVVVGCFSMYKSTTHRKMLGRKGKQ